MPERLLNIIKEAFDEHDINWDGNNDTIWIDDTDGKTYSLNIVECPNENS